MKQKVKTEDKMCNQRQKYMTCSDDAGVLVFKRPLCHEPYIQQYNNSTKDHIYEGCQKSSWTPLVKASNEPDFDIYYYISLM